MDLEWFLQLDKVGKIIILTRHQQSSMLKTTDLNSGAMLGPMGNAFHPKRGIGQGDTLSTLIFIAVFDILFTLLDRSSTGAAHAYADDLIHMAPTLQYQQRQACLRLLRIHGTRNFVNQSRGHLN